MELVDFLNSIKVTKEECLSIPVRGREPFIVGKGASLEIIRMDGRLGIHMEESDHWLQIALITDQGVLEVEKASEDDFEVVGDINYEDLKSYVGGKHLGQS